MNIGRDLITTDYVLAVDPYFEAGSYPSRPITWFEKPIAITDDIFIGPLDSQHADAIMQASESRGEGLRPLGKIPAQYALWRERAPAAPPNELVFDPDDRLSLCVTLSRLVHPTALGFHWAARQRTWADGSREIIPANYCYFRLNPRAFLADPKSNYLVPDDIPCISKLFAVCTTARLPSRLSSALWYLEVAFRHYYADLRWPLLVTALEALVHIWDEKVKTGKREGRPGTKRVFVGRLLILGLKFPALQIPEDDLNAFYEQRSNLVHGQSFPDLDVARRSLYDKLESYVRLVLRTAILDPAVQAVFATDAAIKAELPLSG